MQIAARVVETALHKLHELDFDVRRVVAGFGSCPLPPVADDDMAALGRTNDAVLYGGQVHLTVESDDDDALRELAWRPFPSGRYCDARGDLRLTIPVRGWDYYVGLAFTEIRVAGSHQPQIARFADSHLVVQKEASKGRTQVSVGKLDKAGRVEELARMLTGAEITDSARRHARELLKK